MTYLYVCAMGSDTGAHHNPYISVISYEILRFKLKILDLDLEGHMTNAMPRSH
jgi:hypothetical protein